MLGVPNKALPTLVDIETVELTVPAPAPPPSETVLVIFTLPTCAFKTIPVLLTGLNP